MKFLFLGLLLVGLILVSGCTQQKDQQELVEERVEEPLQETNLTENTTVIEEIKEVKDIDIDREPAKEEIKSTLTSLPCSGFQCFMYCQQNMQTCFEYCQSNPSDSTCQGMKSMLDSFGGGAENFKTSPTS